MEIITNIIAGYLKHNKRLCVPKLGTFIVKQSSGEIIFSDLMRNDDGVLRALLTSAGINELAANGMIDRFVFEVRHGVSTNGKMAIESLGEFSADKNNTITFTASTSKQSIGGNIKPPVEILQKIKPQRQPVRPNVKRTVTQQQSREQESLTLGKPDAYLRGLKYDSNKNKKREEGGMSSRRSYRGGGRRWIVLLLFIAIVASAVALLWPRQKEIAHNVNNDITATIECDSTMMDTLPAIDSLNIADIVESNTPSTTTTTPIREINE